MRRTVGLIGYGRFGRVAAKYLARSADVLVFDEKASVRPGARGRIRNGTMASVASQAVVVLAVPISSMRKVLRAMRPHVRPDALVLDVCSVKGIPLRWMREILPRTVSIVGTHPLFGPDSDSGTVRGQRVVICPVRVKQPLMDVLLRKGGRLGLRVSVMTPDAHDRLMAETLLVSQYVGRLVLEAGCAAREWSTPSYDHLKALATVAANDSSRLFVDMWHYNPHARRVAAKLRAAHRRLMSPVRPGRIDS